MDAERWQLTLNPPPRWTVEIQNAGGGVLGASHDARAYWDPDTDTLTIESDVTIATPGTAELIHAHPFFSDTIVVDLQIPEDAHEDVRAGDRVVDTCHIGLTNGGLRRHSAIRYDRGDVP